MNFIYRILAVAGWVWLAIVAAYLIYRLWPTRSPRGFAVVCKEHEKQS